VDFFGGVTSGTVVNISSNSSLGKFYSDAAGTQQIISLTIPAGSSTATFFYKDLSAGNPVITASAQSVTNSATANFTINPHSSIINHITISANATTIAAGGTASFTTTAYDVYGNAWNVSASYTVDGQAFSGTSLTGEIPGAYTVESTYNDKTDRATLIVTPGPVARFIVLTPNSATVGAPFNIRVVALDSLGNLVTGFTGTVALTANGTNLNPSTSGAFTQGQWFGTVTIAQAGSFKITATDSNGHSGISSVFTVSEAITPTPGPTTTNTISATKDGSSTVNIAVNGNITASQYANVTITTNQTAQTTTVSFTVTGQTGTTGYGNITLPKSQIPYGTTITVYIDGQPAENQSYTQDSQNYYVYYSTHFSTNNVELRFNGEKATRPELPLLMIAVIIAVIVAAIAIGAIAVSRQKHKPAKTPQ
jgi:hypothetical protein